MKSNLQNQRTLNIFSESDYRIGLVFVLLIVGFFNSAVLSAATIPITVNITRVTTFFSPDGQGFFYAKLLVNNNANTSVSTNVQIPPSRTILPDWHVHGTANVDGTLPVPVRIELHLVHPGFLGLGVIDDLIDVDPDVCGGNIFVGCAFLTIGRPVADNYGLDLLFDAQLGTWRGDVNSPEQCARGTEGFSAEICFTIEVETSSSGSEADVDGDGIPDSVEMSGLYDTQGHLVADMAAFGADPCRKTIAVEVDYMDGAPDGHSHRPSSEAIAEVVEAFNNAPVPAVTCPYPGFPRRPSGVNLIVDVDNAIAEIEVSGCSPNSVKATNFNAARERYFHYALFVHTWDGTSISGCSDGSKMFVVSLGKHENQIGTPRKQAGTFMHELGHSLGLAHGGGDNFPDKPNYLSVMNYPFQYGIVDKSRFDRGEDYSFIDYSRNVLPPLHPRALDESRGVGESRPLLTQSRIYFNGALNPSRADRAIDWNRNGLIDPDPVSVSFGGGCISPGNNGVLDSARLVDDEALNNIMFNGPNRACDSRSIGDDAGLGPSGVWCVSPGANNVINTAPNNFPNSPRVADDALVGDHVVAGNDTICNTLATGDDVQFAFPGETENIEYGYNDWDNLFYHAAGRRGNGSAIAPHVAPHADLTFEEAKRIEDAYVYFLDELPPNIACGSSDGTWHSSDVVIGCAASDDGTGLANANDAAFTLTTAVPAGTETGSATTGSREICDKKGNCAIAGPIAGNQVDKKPPVAAITAPATGVSYLLSQAVTANYACTDGGAGVAICAGSVANGSAIDTATVGSKTFTVNTVDMVGNRGSASAMYTVIYPFSGFFQPIDNLPTINAAKAGSSVPVKFSIGGDQGLSVFASNYPVSQSVACNSGTVDTIEETATAGTSGLTYEAASGQYSYVWKTNKAWAGTCRQLIIKLADGTEHRANFKFN